MGFGIGDILDVIPGIGDARAQERANKHNIELNRENREWMERMSNTAYQRAMEDMRAGGLNPMLAYQQGGASVPTNAAPVVEAASKSGLTSAAVGAFTGISTAGSQRMQAQTAQAQSESTIALQGAQAANTVQQTAKAEAETRKTIDSIKNQKVKRELEKAQIPLAKVKESAAGLAEKGTKTIEKLSDNILKNTAKPRVDKKTLQYKPTKLEKFMRIFK